MCAVRERGEEQEWEEKLQRKRQRDRERAATHPLAPSVEVGGSGAEEFLEHELGAHIHGGRAIDPPANLVNAGSADFIGSRRALVARDMSLDNQGVAVPFGAPVHHSAEPRLVVDVAEANESWEWAVGAPVLALALAPMTANGKLRANPRIDVAVGVVVGWEAESPKVWVEVHKVQL